MNATDAEERIKAGFRELQEVLRVPNDNSEEMLKAKSNAAAMEREQARARAEYLHLGIEPPSPYALSVTARRELGIAVVYVDERREDVA